MKLKFKNKTSMHLIKRKRKSTRIEILVLILILLALLFLLIISIFGNLFLNKNIVISTEVSHYNHTINNVKFNMNQSITFVFTPFSSSFNYLSKLFNITVRSWINSFPNAKLFIFGNKINFEHINKIISQLTSNYEFVTDIEEDEIGLLYVDDILIKTVEKANTDLICFIMQDTILVPEISRKVSFLYNFYSQQKKQFATIGRRCVSSFPPSGNTSYELFMQKLYSFDQLRNINAIQNAVFSNDFILFSLNDNRLDFSDIPPFLFGLYEWDTWIPGWMNEKIPLISLGNECASYHIQHSKTIISKAKVSENYEISQMHPKENLIYSDLSLYIDNYTLYDGHNPIAVAEYSEES